MSERALRFENGWGFRPEPLAPLLDQIPNESGLWIGYSLGGLRLLDTLQANPTDPPKLLVLIAATLSFVERPQAPYGTPRSQLRAIRAGLGRDSEKTLRNFCRLCFAPDKPPADTAELMRTEDAETIIAETDELLTFDFTAADFPRLPTLVLHGADDEVTSPEAARALADAFDATPVYAQDAGHGLPITHATWCAERIGEAWKACHSA